MGITVTERIQVTDMTRATILPTDTILPRAPGITADIRATMVGIGGTDVE